MLATAMAALRIQGRDLEADATTRDDVQRRQGLLAMKISRHWPAGSDLHKVGAATDVMVIPSQAGLMSAEGIVQWIESN
jgi:hypothetical protein